MVSAVGGSLCGDRHAETAGGAGHDLYGVTGGAWGRRNDPCCGRALLEYKLLVDWGGDEQAAPRRDLDPDRWLGCPTSGRARGGVTWPTSSAHSTTGSRPTGSPTRSAGAARSPECRERDRHPQLIGRWQASSAEC